MRDFEFTMPTRFAFGRGAEGEAGRMCAEFGGKRVLVVFGGESARKSGLLGRMEKSLTAQGLHTTLLGGVEPNPSAKLVYEGVLLCREDNIDFVLAVGGGSVIDTAKAIALGVRYDGDFWDCYSGKGTCAEALPVGVVLTIPGSGSEGCGSSVITGGKDKLKRSVTADALIPKFALMNPELTYTLPPYQTACGCTDILSHCFERYFSQSFAADVSDRLAEALMQTVLKYAPLALERPDDYEARANLMWSGTLAHNNLVALGRQTDFACHRMEHELSALYNVAHGAGLAAITPAWMRTVCRHGPERFARWANQLFGVDIDFGNLLRGANRGIDRLEAFYRRIGMPTSMEELGARPEDIPLLTEKCQMNNGDRCGFFHPLERQDIAGIYRRAFRSQ